MVKRNWKAVLLFLVAIGVAFLVWRGEQDRANQIHRQDQTIQLQCNINYIVDDLVTASVVFAEQPPRLAGWRQFVRRFETDHRILIRLLTDKESLCVRS
jgi:hypothetical protein